MYTFSYILKELIIHSTMSSIIYMFNIAVSVSINYILKMIDDMVCWYHSDEK